MLILPPLLVMLPDMVRDEGEGLHFLAGEGGGFSAGEKLVTKKESTTQAVNYSMLED